MSYQIGELAEKYEVGGRGPGYISDGDKWDPGGDSYGSYQLATKVGTLQGYLKSKTDKYTKELNKYRIKTIAFNAAWKDLAKADPEGFKQSQFDYVSTISYKPCRKYADKIALKKTEAINSALFSISNQHGGWRKILDHATILPGDSEKVQLDKLYSARKDYILSLSSLSDSLKRSLIKQRCDLERADAIKLLGRPDPDTSDTSSTPAPAPATEPLQSLPEPIAKNPLINKAIDLFKTWLGK